MNQGFTSVPFKAESGLSSVNGIAKFSAAGIVLEFESKLLGLIASGVKEFKIPTAEILDVKFRKGFMKRGAKIEVRTRTFTTMAELPNKDGKLTLKLDKDDFDLGRQAVEQFLRDTARASLDQPPPQTPVSQLFEDDSEEETRKLER